MIYKWLDYSKKILNFYSGIEGCSGTDSSSFMEGRDSKTFLSEPTDAVIVNTTLITIKSVAVIAVSLDRRLADPRADIIPPNVPPPRPRPSLSEP